MNENTREHEITSLVQGDLDEPTARALRARLAADPALHAEFTALAAADRALLEALGTPARTGHRTTHWWRPALAAAAVVVVAALLATARADRAAAHNDVVGLRVAPVGDSKQPVFTDAAIEFVWENRIAATGCEVMIERLGADTTIAALAADRAKAAANPGKAAPVVVRATLHAPDGARIPARLADDATTIATTATRRVPLRAFVLDAESPPPYLGGAPGDREWREDFLWAIGNMPSDGPRRFLLDQVGEWTIELRVESVPPPVAGGWPTFAEPLVVATKVIATGLVSDWGPTHDGMRARLVLATGCSDLDHAPLAVQLQNVGDHPRTYNVVGITMAKVPQPFHWSLLVATGDGDPARMEPRKNLGVVMGHDNSMIRHAPGATRSLVACADYWRLDGKGLVELAGAASLAAEFHFEATLWDSNDRELWQGRLPTGALRLPPRTNR
ncbi:MAG: hypothetical protein JNK78_04940 [Planctomycetes bacterium]|nr:hypothetical protein [Planctomycetota bacterium]